MTHSNPIEFNGYSSSKRYNEEEYVLYTHKTQLMSSSYVIYIPTKILKNQNIKNAIIVRLSDGLKFIVVGESLIGNNQSHHIYLMSEVKVN